MPEKARDRLIIALDVDTLAEAADLVGKLDGHVGMFKVGMQLWAAYGPQAVEAIASKGGGVFLDLKFHDIPNTVAQAGRLVTRPGVRMFNVHTSGGLKMMAETVRISRKEAEARRIPAPVILGVTVLTSFDAAVLLETGVPGEVEQVVVQRALLAQRAGMDGVVASPREAQAIRNACGPGFVIVTPGVRPVWAESNDQQRMMTPGEAVKAGADYLVVGRPITSHPQPEVAACRVLEEMGAAFNA
ncbi:MAG: orotidine-5'-phosphate decarboxylase [Bacillota bacterium]